MSASDSHDGKSSSRTLARKDWCEAGLEALTADGEKGLTISRLAERLGVTYGSFYHHFGNSEEFHAAVLKHWFQELLVPLARRNLAASRPSMEAVVRDVESSGYSPVEIAVRRWARDYAPAATAVRRADRYRMRVMGQMLQKRGVPPAEARAKGELMLLSYLGALQHAKLKNREAAMKELVKMIDEIATGIEGE